MVQIQPRTPVLDHADFTTPIRQHELYIQIRSLSSVKDLDHEVGIDDLDHDLSDT